MGRETTPPTVIAILAKEDKTSTEAAASSSSPTNQEKVEGERVETITDTTPKVEKAHVAVDSEKDERRTEKDKERQENRVPFQKTRGGKFEKKYSSKYEPHQSRPPFSRKDDEQGDAKPEERSSFKERGRGNRFISLKKILDSYWLCIE